MPNNRDLNSSGISLITMSSLGLSSAGAMEQSHGFSAKFSMKGSALQELSSESSRLVRAMILVGVLAGALKRSRFLKETTEI
jgi:hypothetical protein